VSELLTADHTQGLESPSRHVGNTKDFVAKALLFPHKVDR